MYNDVECCNIALLRCKGQVIERIGEASREGSLAKIYFPLARDAVLSRHPWSFAKLEATLALLPEEENYEGWDFAYAYPNDCLKPWYIVNPSSKLSIDQIEFAVANRKSGSGAQKVLLTNEEVPRLIYTRQISDISVFPISVLDAVTWRLSMEFSTALGGDVKLAQNFRNMYEMQLATAKADDANSEYEKPRIDNAYKRARR